MDEEHVNVRQLVFHNEKLEQYTRRDNLRLFNFPLCEDDDPRAKFIELVAVLGFTIQTLSINYPRQGLSLSSLG